MSSVYKKLVESFGYTPITEGVSLDDIMAAVSQDKDEQSRAAKLNDIAWKEKLPGLYDPVSGYYVRKQSMPTGMAQKYSIAATGTESSDKALADLGLLPDNAKTSTAIGRMFRGDDKGQYDQDIKLRNQAAKDAKNPPVAPAPDQSSAETNRLDRQDGGQAGQPTSQVTVPGQGGDIEAKRKRYAELLAKAKASKPTQASVRNVDNNIEAGQ